jgi:hypothetical protein
LLTVDTGETTKTASSVFRSLDDLIDGCARVVTELVDE